FETLRDDDLEGISSTNVFLNSFDAFDEMRATGSLLRLNSFPISTLLRRTKDGIEPAFKSSDVAHRAGVCCSCFFIANVRGCDDVDLLAHMIKGEYAIEEHEHAVGNL